MKFLSDLSLKKSTAYLFLVSLAILTVEFSVVWNQMDTVNGLHRSIDYVRVSQKGFLELSLLVRDYQSGQNALAPDILAALDRQGRQIQAVGDGDRADGSTLFLHPLSRLPKISHNQLALAWRDYQHSVQLLISGQVKADVPPLTVPGDSVQASEEALPPIETEILMVAQWKNTSLWYDRLIDDLMEEAMKKQASIQGKIPFFLCIDALVLALIYILFIKKVVKPIVQIGQHTVAHQHTLGLPAHELGVTAHHVNEVIEQLKDATDFVQRIGEGKLDMDYRELDSEYSIGKNILADSLVSMQSKLKTINEEEEKRKWANEGLAKFVDILRSSNDNIQTLGDKVVSALVHYTGACQGGLYLLNEEDSRPYLELVSLYAFDTKKFETQRIRLGEGLLGQAFLEKETTYFTQLPQDYARITSGLGGTNPASLLIVPMKIDKEVLGLVELASFKPFLPHEVSFVEKLGETIASTLASVKSAQNNRKLLEESQSINEQVRAQEEEMRQNMEELLATQEEMARKEKDYIARIQHMEESMKGAVPQSEVDKSRSEWEAEKQFFSDKIQSLEEQLRQKPVGNQEWEMAEQVEKTLKIQLESIKLAKSGVNQEKA